MINKFVPLTLLAAGAAVLFSCQEYSDDDYLAQQEILEMTRDRAEASAKAYEATMNNMRSLIDRLQSENVELTELVKEKVREISVLNGLIADLNAENSELRETIDALTARIAVLVEEVDALTQENESLNATVTELSDEVLDLTFELQTATESNTVLTGQVSSLTADLEAAYSAYRSLSNAAGFAIANLNSQVDALTTSNASTEAQLGQALTIIVDLKTKLRNRRDRIQRLKDKIDALQASQASEINQYISWMMDMSDEIQRLRDEVTGYEQLLMTIDSYFQQYPWAYGKLQEAISSYYGN